MPPAPLRQALAEAFDRVRPTESAAAMALSSPALGGRRGMGPGHFAGRVRALCSGGFKLLAFIIIKRDKIFFLGHRWSSSWA